MEDKMVLLSFVLWWHLAFDCSQRSEQRWWQMEKGVLVGSSTSTHAPVESFASTSKPPFENNPPPTHHAVQ